MDARTTACVSKGNPRRPEFLDDRLLLRFENTTIGLDARLRELREFLEVHDVGVRGRYRAELAFEELVINVIRHAYRDREIGKHPIDVSVSVRDGETMICVEDEGPPFNPLHMPAPATPLRLEDCSIGGLGLPLVRFATAQMQYERAAGKNRLTVTIPRD